MSLAVSYKHVHAPVILRGVYGDTTRCVVASELRRGSVYSDADATQLDVELSTSSHREQLSPISSERRDPVDSVCRS